MSGFLLIIYSKITDAYTLYLIKIFRYVLQYAELYRYLLKQTRFNLNLLFQHKTRQIPPSPLDSQLLVELNPSRPNDPR